MRNLVWFGFGFTVAAATVLMGCGGGTAVGSVPSREHWRLEVVGLAEGRLEVGGSVLLAADYVGPAGQREHVPTEEIRWVAKPESVVFLASGRATGLRLGDALVTAFVGAQSASAEATVVAPGRIPIRDDISGRWTGDYAVESCRRVKGKGQTACRFVTEKTHPIVLDTVQDGRELNGTLQLGCSSGKVTGRRNLGGETLFRGKLICEQSGSRLALSDWEVQFRFPQRSAIGTLNVVQESITVEGESLYVMRLRIKSLVPVGPINQWSKAK